MLNGSEGRQQSLFVAGIELDVVTRRRGCVETDRVGDDKRDGLCLCLADGLRRCGASIAAVQQFMGHFVNQNRERHGR